MSNPALPGGRGKRFGQDAIIDQRESELQRQSQLPSARGYYWSSLAHGFGHIDSSGTLALTADTLLLTFCRPPQSGVSIRSVSSHAVAIGAAPPGIVDVGVYVFQRANRLLTLLPKSLGVLQWAVAGIRGDYRYPVPWDLPVAEDVLLAVATRRRANTVSLHAGALWAGFAVSRRTYPLVSTAPFPGRLDYAALTDSGSGTHPDITFFSGEWGSVL